MSRRPQSALPYSPSSPGPGGSYSPGGRARMTYSPPRSPSPSKRAMSGRASLRADAQPPPVKPPTAKKVRDEIVRAAYAAKSIAALEDAISRAPMVDRAKGEVGREFVDCGRLIVRLMQMKNDIKQHIKRGDRSALLHIKRLIQESVDISARSPLPKAATAEVLVSFNYKKSMEAIGFCDTDIEASESMAAMDVRAADAALAKARKEGNEATVERLEAFNQQKDVIGQRNAHLKLKVSAAGEETENLRSGLTKAQQELQRVRGLLEQQDGLVGQCRAERDEARRMAKQIEEDGELLLAEAQEETNAVRAELAKQAEKTKQLQQALSQKAKEVTELRRHISAGDLLKMSARLAEDELQENRPDSPTLRGKKAVELNGLIQKTKREELLEGQVQRLTEKIEIYQRMYRIGIV